MKILITGATGYIGSSLTEYIDNETNHSLKVLTRELPTYFQDWENRFEVIEASVLDPEALSSAIGDDVDAIVHLAAYNDIDTAADPKNALLVNGFGTRNVLDAASETGCSNVIYFSTQKVYGQDLEGTYTTSSPLNCHGDYAVTHAVAEHYAQMFANSTEINATVVRPSNVFGCPIHSEIDRWTLVPACFCKSVVEEGEIRLRSSGHQTRDFINLEAVNDSVNRIIESPGVGFSIYNIASETQISILQVARIVRDEAEDLLGEEIDIVQESERPRTSNEFLVRNNLSDPPSEAETKEQLAYEAKSMIKMLVD